MPNIAIGRKHISNLSANVADEESPSRANVAEPQP